MYCRRSAVDDVRSRRTRAVDEDRRRIRWAVDEDRHRRRWAIDDDRRRRRREIDDYPPLELPLQWRDPPLEYPSLFHFASRKGIRKQPVVVDDYPPLELPLRWRDPPPEYPPLELPLRWRDPPLPITSVSDSVHLQRKPTRARPDASAQLTGPIPAPSPPAAADQTPAHPTSDSPTRHVHELDLSRPYPSLVACFDSVEMELQLEICRLPALPADDSKAVRVPDSAMEGNHSNSVVYPAPPPARARSVPCCSRETDDEREPTPCDERDSTPGYERISAPGDERIFAPKTVTPGAIAMLLSIGDRQLDLDKQQSIAAKAEPKTEKDAESLSLTKQIPGWSDGIPPFGFMAHVPPPPFGLDDASTSSSKAVQRLFSSQLRPKALCNSLLYCTDRESPSADDKISSILVCSSCHPMQKGNLPANPSTDSSQKKTTSGRNKFVKLVEWTEPYLSNSQKLHCIMNPDANHGDGETKLNDNYNVGDVNDFTAGVEMPGLNSTENIDPTRCSQVARRNVADDYGYLFLGSSSGVGERMLLRIQQQGLYITPRILIVTRLLPDAVGTTCGQHLEKVIGTEHTDYCQIFRVPFRTENRIIRQWISCFEVWPYLETYADDVADKLVGELLATPDLIIGNYSNGNLVAFLLAHKLGVTQYTKAHALKKTKYPNSDIYWKNFEEQFTADLITMNHADFIIKSTFQEFAGRQGLSRLYGHDSNPQTTHVVWTLGYVISEVTRIRTAITSTDVFSLRRFLREDMYKRIKIFDPGGLLMISTPISLPLITSTESSFLNARGE